MRKEIFEHFEKIAPHYDQFKKRNYYYYRQLKELYLEEIKNAKTALVLEIGTGTGEILAVINPGFGLGIDPIYEMVKIATYKFREKKNLSFIIAEAEALPLKFHFDYIILPDVIEHLHNVNDALREIKRIADKSTTIIITWANSIWKPILDLLEILKLKMPEGPHNWLKRSELLRLIENLDFTVVKEGTKCLIPAKIPFLSDFINKVFLKIPLLNRLGLIRYLIIKPK